jgi:hypothetical protein
MWKYLTNREKNLRLARAKTRATSAKILESALESWENSEKILRPRHTIYRGGGGTFKNLPRFNRCEIYGGRVSTPTFRGWRFLPEFVGFCGNGSSKLTRFPDGLVLGNSINPCHPRNVGVSKFMKHIRETIIGKGSDSWEKGEMKNLNKLRMFPKLSEKHENNRRTGPLYLNSQSVAGWAIFAEAWNQEIAKAWNQEVAEIWNHEPVNLWKQGSAKLYVQISEIRELWMKDSGIWRRPSQRRNFKSPALAYELGAGL